MKKAIQLEDDVREVLAAAEVEGNVLRLVGQLERKLYERTNKALEALGGKWNRGKKGHVFDGDPRAAIEAATVSGEVAHPNPDDFFPTPPEVAMLACQRLGADRGHRILEPSAGEGDLIAPLLEWFGKSIIGDLVLYEKDPKRCGKLGAKGLGTCLFEADFLAASPLSHVRADRILMNPPFHNGADSKHIAHALDFLVPGGRLVAIASAGIKSRADKATKALRDKLATWGASFEDLPAGAFKKAGTNVTTVLITVTRPR